MRRADFLCACSCSCDRGRRGGGGGRACLRRSARADWAVRHVPSGTCAAKRLCSPTTGPRPACAPATQRQSMRAVLPRRRRRHAGFTYSGPTAAWAYMHVKPGSVCERPSRLQPAAAQCTRTGERIPDANVRTRKYRVHMYRALSRDTRTAANASSSSGRHIVTPLPPPHTPPPLRIVRSASPRVHTRHGSVAHGPPQHSTAASVAPATACDAPGMCARDTGFHLRGCMTSQCVAYETPVGDIPIDLEGDPLPICTRPQALPRSPADAHHIAAC